jgi:hypothetical protein
MDQVPIIDFDCDFHRMFAYVGGASRKISDEAAVVFCVHISADQIPLWRCAICAALLVRVARPADSPQDRIYYRLPRK